MSDKNKSIDFNEIEFIKTPPVHISQDEIKSLEEELWIKFPNDYSEYLTKLGQGTLIKRHNDGDLAFAISIYPPWRIHEDLPQWRQRIKDYWFWDNEPRILPKERALESIVLGDTVDGDELVFHPQHPNKLFILPHGSENVFLAGSNIKEAIDFLVSQSNLKDAQDGFVLEPSDTRIKMDSYDDDFYDDPQDPPNESIGELIKRTREWEIRHSARKQAKESLKKQVNSNMKSAIIKEGICSTTDEGDIGYFIEYLITDIESGKKVGIFKFHKNSQSWGTSWKPNSVQTPLT